MPDQPNKDDDFEIVDPSEVQFAKRGRKSVVNPELTAKLKTLKPGQALTVKSMTLDTKSADYKTAKAKVSAQLRTACRAAGIEAFDIKWTLNGTPTVCR